MGFKSYFISKNAQVASEQVVIGDELPTSGRQTKTILGEYFVLDYVILLLPTLEIQKNIFSKFLQF